MKDIPRGAVLWVLPGLLMAGLLLTSGDVPAVIRALAAFPPMLFIPVVLFALWNYALRWIKWQYYLRVLGLSEIHRVDSALVFVSGFAMGLTPGRAGEFAKSYWLRELAGAQQTPIARIASVVFAERLTDGLALLLLASAGLAMVHFGAAVLLLVWALALAFIALLQATPLVHRALGCLARVRLARRLAETLLVSYSSARELLRWRRLAFALALGTVSWAGECAALYTILVGLHAQAGLELFTQATFALTSGTLVGIASMLPGGVGAADGTVSGLLQMVAGQPADVASAATLLIRACTLWLSIGLGVATLPLLGRRMFATRRIRAEA